MKFNKEILSFYDYFNQYLNSGADAKYPLLMSVIGRSSIGINFFMPGLISGAKIIRYRRGQKND
jgi:hypothetical protein